MNKFLYIVFIFLMNIHLLWARAGGAGGGGSRSGGGSHGGSFGGGSYGRSYSSGGGYYSYGSRESNPMVTLFIMVAILAIYIWIYKNKKAQNSNDQYQDEDINQVELLSGESLDAELKNKVEIAFHSIQKCWSQKTIAPMRRFISDGVYQRFNAQFTMMNLSHQKNPISRLQIIDMKIASKWSDGAYDVVDVKIKAYAEDQFVSDKFPELNSPGNAESFVEYWSFIRRKDFEKGHNIFKADTCPKCSAPMTAKLMESAQCPYCQTYINNGEYDWVLAEIVQEADYIPTENSSRVPSKVYEVMPDFSRKVIEDKASNAFMQIMIASATNSPEPLSKFTTKELYQKLFNVTSKTNFLFDRLYLNEVNLEKVSVDNDFYRVRLSVKFTFRRIQIHENQLNIIDSDQHTENKNVVMLKSKNSQPAKGTIYANTCPTCGAPQKDNLNYVCAYCGQAMNDSTLDWIVEELT